MHIIEPCCAVKHVADLRRALGACGTLPFEGYGDLSLTELLPAILTRYSGAELLIAAPSLPGQAVDIIRKWMAVQWPRMDGSGNVYAVRHLTIVADLRKKKSPEASQWLKDNPFGERLTLVGRQQDDTVILLPDLAIEGPVNMRYGHHFTATATADAEHIADLWKRYASEEETKEEEVADAGGEPAEDAAGDATASGGDMLPRYTAADDGPASDE